MDLEANAFVCALYLEDSGQNDLGCFTIISRALVVVIEGVLCAGSSGMLRGVTDRNCQNSRLQKKKVGKVDHGHSAP